MPHANLSLVVLGVVKLQQAMKRLNLEKHIKTLHENRWVSLKSMRHPFFGKNEYVFSHETRCKGKILSILPFRRNGKGIISEFLIRKEVTPCWGTKQWMSSITGGVEGKNIRKHAQVELMEEAGYKVSRKDIMLIGKCFGSKSCDTVYTLLSADLTGKQSFMATGDGSFMETLACCEWVNEEELGDAVDPLVFANWYKLMGVLLKNGLYIKKGSKND